MSAPDLYADALAIVREKGFVSVSMIQRCLRIGYSAAQDLAEQMMSRGDVDGLPRPPALNVPRVRGNTNNEKSTADMQPAPATEQARTLLELSRLVMADAPRDVLRAAARQAFSIATQAERVQSSESIGNCASGSGNRSQFVSSERSARARKT